MGGREVGMCMISRREVSECGISPLLVVLLDEGMGVLGAEKGGTNKAISDLIYRF